MPNSKMHFHQGDIFLLKLVHIITDSVLVKIIIVQEISVCLVV